MFANCGKSFCQFLDKCFHLNKNNKRRISSRRINTSNVINSNDLHTYLFADDCETCKHRRSISKSKNGKWENKKKNNNFEEPHNLGDYQPPINIGSCDSFQSIISDDEYDSDIDSEDELTQVDIKNIKTIKKKGIKSVKIVDERIIL